jgi:hypothetical protein
MHITFGKRISTVSVFLLFLAKISSAMSQKKQMKKEVKNKNSLQFAFQRENYIYMFVGLGLLALGFLLMIGGGSDTVTKFNPAIFDFRRLTLAPILILAGYGMELYAIMKRPKQPETKGK